ncbi:MAG: hypothetical protein QM770_10915 [Tepidisphaeraceae bacterium]
MERIATSASPGNVNLTAGFTNVIAAPAPVSGAKHYLAVISLQNLDLANAVTVREAQNDFVFMNRPVYSMASTSIIEVDITVNAGDAPVYIAIHDEVSTAASFTCALYDITPGAGGTGDSSWTHDEKAKLIGDVELANKRLLASVLKQFGVTSKADFIKYLEALDAE